MDRDGDISSFCGASAIGSSPLFPHPALLTLPRSSRPAAERADRCLPPACASHLPVRGTQTGADRRHRQAVGLQCFCHWCVTGCFHRCFPLLFPPCPPPGERAPLITIAWSVFSSFSLEKRQGIKQGHFIVLRCAHPWIITAVSTPRLPTHPTLTATPQPTR